MKKRILHLGTMTLLTVVLLTLLWACGATPAQSDVQSPVPEVTTTPEPTSTPEPTPEPTPTPEPIIITTSYGKPSKGGNENYSSKTENYCGSIDSNLTCSFPDGGDMHGISNDSAKNYLFPESDDLGKVSLYVTDSGTLSKEYNVYADTVKSFYIDVYQGTLIDGNVEYVKSQSETDAVVTLNMTGFSRWVWLTTDKQGGVRYNLGDVFVISTEDATNFIETGILRGYENAPFLDSLREELKYAYKETETIYPAGAPDPLPTPEPTIVISYGRPYTSEDAYCIEKYTNACGNVETGLTYTFPERGDLHGIPKNYNDQFFLTSPTEYGSAGLYITDSGTMPMELTTKVDGFKAVYTDVYQGAVIDGNVEFVKVQSETDVSATLNMTGFSRWVWIIDLGNGSYSWSFSDCFVISTEDANTFVETGVLTGYENAPFLDSLREELKYAYKVTEPVR